MKKLFLLILSVLFLEFVASAQTNLMDSPIPSQLAKLLPPGAPAFDPDGLSFTNVNFKAAAGTVMTTSSGGTHAYAQADEDIFHTKIVDIGLGQEVETSSTGSGFQSAALDVELIKNLSNWQLVGKGGFGRNFEDNIGNFANFGFDVNYNLTKGVGLAFLGTSAGSFTYVGAGVKWNDKNFSLNASQKDIDKKFTVYAGWAF